MDDKSSIDHVFVHKDLVPLITEYKVLLDATNCSDHLPVQVCLSFNCNDCHTSGCSTIGSLFNMYIDGTKVICRAIMSTLVICCLKYANSLLAWIMVNIVTAVCVISILTSNTVRLCTVLISHRRLAYQPCIPNKKAVLPQGNRAMPQVFFSVEVRQQHCLQV